MSRKEFVAWDIPEPFKESKEPPWKILPIKHNASVRGLVLSDAIVGVKTHWINNRTKPCITQQRGCEACSHGVAWRWKGYLAVWLVASRTGWLLEVTQWAFDHNLQLSCTEGLRGLDFIAKRTKPANNAPVEIDLLPSLTPLEHVPPCPDVQEILSRIWFGRERNYRKEKKGE